MLEWQKTTSDILVLRKLLQGLCLLSVEEEDEDEDEDE
jgi:hypothetical protein